MKPPVEFRAALAEASKHVVLAAAEAADADSWNVASHCTEAIKQISQAMRCYNLHRRERKGH